MPKAARHGGPDGARRLCGSEAGMCLSAMEAGKAQASCPSCSQPWGRARCLSLPCGDWLCPLPLPWRSAAAGDLEEFWGSCQPEFSLAGARVLGVRLLWMPSMLLPLLWHPASLSPSQSPSQPDGAGQRVQGWAAGLGPWPRSSFWAGQGSGFWSVVV